MRLSHERQEYGFTLIELMVTLAVMAIVLVAATPSFVDFFDKNRVRAAADGVVNMIGNSRAEAVKNDRDVNITFKGSAATWCVGANAAIDPTGGNPVTAAAACDCTVSTSCLVGNQRAVVDSTAFSGVSIGTLPATFDFDSKLGVISPLGTRSVTLTSPKGKYDLIIQLNALGQGRLCVPTGKPAIAGIVGC
jgi:type IV fimbrial biogenesis protein FimT